MAQYIHDLPASSVTDSAIFLIDKLTNNAWSTGKISGSDLQNYLSLANFVKTTTDALVNYYKKSETYSKTEVNTLIENVKNSRFEKVETLPATGESNVIYLLPRQDTETGNIYDEYIWVDNAWEKIASTDIDLSGYVTIQQLNTALADYMTTAAFNAAIANYYNKSEINSQMAAKVDVEPNKGLSTNDYTTIEKDKLAGISPSAKKVSASTTNGNILIDDTETQVYDDSEIQGDLSTAIVETEASNPLTFTTRSAQNAQSAEIILEPIQDLHGYDHPWVGGAGKNILPCTISNIKRITSGTDATWNGNTCTVNGVSFTVNTDDADNVQSIVVSGTPNGDASHLTIAQLRELRPLLDLVGTDVVGSGCPSGGSTSTYLLAFARLDGGFNNDSGNGRAFTISDFSEQNAYVRISIYTTVSNLVFKPMIRLASESDPTFAPYSNYCPISGHTEVSVGGCGKNLLSTPINGGRTNSGITWTYHEDGTISASGTAEKNSWSYPSSTCPSAILPQGTYTVSVSSPFGLVVWIDGNKAYDGNKNIYTFELEEEKTVAVTARVGEGSTVNATTGIMLATGSTATAYEPYTPSNDLTKDLGQEVFGASYNPVSGKLVVDRAKIKASELTFTRYSGLFYAQVSGKLNDAVNFLLCDRLYSYDVNAISISSAVDILSVDASCCASINTSNPYIYVRWDEYTTVADFTAAIADTEVVYELATPITYHLTPDEIKLLSGVNTIWTDGTSIKIAYRDGKVATLADLDSIKAVSSMDKLTDTEITSPQVGDTLVWNGTKWVNQVAVSEMHHYSTEEQVVGTWIDGKPLYEKTVYFTTPTQSQANTEIIVGNIGINNATILRQEYIFYCNGSLSHSYNDGVLERDGWKSVTARTVDGYIYVKMITGSGDVKYDAYCEQNAFVIIQYTKTTDTAQTQSNLAQLETQAQTEETQAVEQTEDI